MRPPKLPPLALLLIGLLSLPAGARSVASIKLNRASTRVGIASVYLHMEDLHIVGHRLDGKYRIKIPLAPKMNDRGDFVLESDSLEQVITSGGTLVGSGHSRLDGRTHGISCEFEPRGRVRITVETPDRVLSFKTDYQILDGS